MLVKLVLIDPLIESMAVRIPTNEKIPITIIMMVNKVRSNCVRIERKAMRIFSRNKLFNFQESIFFKVTIFESAVHICCKRKIRCKILFDKPLFYYYCN